MRVRGCNCFYDGSALLFVHLENNLDSGVLVVKERMLGKFVIHNFVRLRRTYGAI